MEKQIRVLVLDASHMGTQLFCEVLGRDKRFQLVAARSLEDLTAEGVDVALIANTAQLGAFQGTSLIHEIRRRSPNLPVVVIVEDSNRSVIVDAMRAGARGVLCRSEPIKTLGKCLNCVYNGQVWANQKELEYLLEALADPVPIRLVDAKGASLLSAREQDVVRWVAEGFTNREIADRLELSEHTIKNYLFRIFEKLGISNRMELLLYVVSQLPLRKSGVTTSEPTSNDINGDKGRFEAAGSLPAYLLAERYRRGEGVPVDLVCSYMWFEVARAFAQNIEGGAALALDQLKQDMTPKQVEEGKRRAGEWLLKEKENGNGQRDSLVPPEAA